MPWILIASATAVDEATERSAAAASVQGRKYRFVFSCNMRGGTSAQGWVSSITGQTLVQDSWYTGGGSQYEDISRAQEFYANSTSFIARVKMAPEAGTQSRPDGMASVTVEEWRDSVSWVKVSSEWKPIVGRWVKVNGQWRQVVGQWIKVNGQWRQA
ncbi:hypothetical protein ACE6ED_13425 [Paenibacillus sp. CN-4]|uniref:hypothetical protein n=1 Tax=Paenibacillus nanchangensis TaxID=3348343 RepID=UPI0039798862